MNRLLSNLGAVIVMLFALNIQAQNTPAPCDPANLIPSDVQYGCYNTPDCVTGWMCFFIRVQTDAFYGTTCSEQPMYLCGFPNVPALYKKEKDHAQTILARLRALRRDRARLNSHSS